jgi:hypothetical protein
VCRHQSHLTQTSLALSCGSVPGRSRLLPHAAKHCTRPAVASGASPLRRCFESRHQPPLRARIRPIIGPYSKGEYDGNMESYWPESPEGARTGWALGAVRRPVHGIRSGSERHWRVARTYAAGLAGGDRRDQAVRCRRVPSLQQRGQARCVAHRLSDWLSRRRRSDRGADSFAQHFLGE